MLLALRATIVAACLAMLPGLLEGWETPKAAIVRMAGFGCVAAIVATPGAFRRLKLQPLDLAVAVWLLVELITTVFSRAPMLSLFGEIRQHEGFFTSLSFAGLYLSTRVATRDVTDARALLDAILIGAGLASLYAFFQALDLDPVPWSQAAMVAGHLRPFGTMGHPNVLGIVTAAAFGIALGRALDPGTRRWIYAAASIGLAAATAITLSRGAWLGLGAAALVALIFGARGRGASMRPLLLIVAGVLAALILLAIFGPATNPMVARLRDLVSPGTGTGRTRLEIWRTALAAWKARPWIGHGPDTLAMVFTQFQTPDYWKYEWLGLAGHAHDIYLHVLATRGALGLAAGALCAVCLLLAARAGWTDGSRPVVAACLAALAGLAVAGAFGALGITGALCLTVTAAILGSLASAPAPVETPAPARGKPGRAPAPKKAPVLADGGWPSLAAGAVFAIAIGFFMAREIGMSRQLSIAYGWIGLGRASGDPGAQPIYADMESRCRKVLFVEPWDDNAPAVLSETLLRWGFGSPDARSLLAQAEAAAREAIRRVPLREANHRRLALVLATEAQAVDPKRMKDAEDAFATAAHLAPQDAVLLVEWTRTRIAMHKLDDALATANNAVTRYPESGVALGALGEAQLALRDTTEARLTLQRATYAEQGTDPAAQQRAAALLASLGPAR